MISQSMSSKFLGLKSQNVITPRGTNYCCNYCSLDTIVEESEKLLTNAKLDIEPRKKGDGSSKE